MADPLKFTTKMPKIPDIDVSDSQLNLFDQNSNDINLFNLVDDELIRISGSKMQYFKCYIDENYDPVYQEERKRVVAAEPIVVHGHYDPTQIEQNLTQFGVVIENDQTFVFNKSYIEQKLHRAPQPGDLIRPLFSNLKYEIFQVTQDSFEVYGIYHYNCQARIARDYQEVINNPSNP